MATTETRKLDLLARFSQTEFFSHGSKLNYAKLDRFILIAFLLHFSVVLFGLVAPLYTKKPLTPPPIKVKYVNIQTSVPLKQKQTPADSLKPKISQKKKTKSSGLLARTSHKTFAKKQYPKQKKHRQIKTTTSKAQNIPSIIHQLRPQVTKKKKGENQQKAPPVSSKFMGSKGTLAMLDELNQEKYAPENPQVEEKEELDNDEPISLDTKEAKYVSYFSRIKQQIQRVWVYPSQGIKRTLSGELTLKFEISKDGNLLSLRLINSSGSNILDANAVKAVRGAAPYYPFPITITKKKLSILATFVYNAK
ncbi:MAG: energy transducer TonB [Gammaproteobacteria bacterium]|nr:energy transducer TonB [Gammaproteobacteria bacterium]